MSRLPMMLTSIAVVAVCIGLNVHRYPMAWEYMRLAVSSLRPMDSDGKMDVSTGTTSRAVRECDAEGRVSSELSKKETVEPTLPTEKFVSLDPVEMDKTPNVSSSETQVSESQQVRRISFPEEAIPEGDSPSATEEGLPLLPNVENEEDKDNASSCVDAESLPECLTTPHDTDAKSETVTETAVPSVIEAKESDVGHSTEVSESRDDSSVALMTQVVEVGEAEAEVVTASTENTTRTDSISPIASPIRQHRVLRTSKTQVVSPLNPVVLSSDQTPTHSVIRSISEEKNSQKASAVDTPTLSKDVTESLPSTNEPRTNALLGNMSDSTREESRPSVIWHSSNSPLTRQRIREMLASPPVETPSH